MSRFNLKSKIQILIVLMLLLILGVSVFILAPRIKRINDLKQTVENSEDQIEKNYQRTKVLRKSITELDNMAQKVEKFEEMLITKGDELRVITMLENVAEKNNIIQELSVSFVADTQLELDSDGRKNKLNRPYHNFMFANEGRFEDLIHYLWEVEQLPFYLVIDKLSWRQKGKDSGDMVVLSFIGRVYSAN